MIVRTNSHAWRRTWGVIACGLLLPMVYLGCTSVEKPAPSASGPSPSQTTATIDVRPSPGRSWVDVLLFRSGEKKPEPAQPATPALDRRGREGRWWHVRNLLFFWWPKGKPPPPAAAPLFASGTVFSVNQPGGFAIIEAPQGQQLPVGTVLSTLREGRVVATVRLTADRRPPFIVADLMEGLPTRGDAVFAVQLD